jgi:L-iditol 2-dehydrogenase
MKALVKVATGPGNLELRELPDPAPGPGEVVLRIAGTGICGTDLHIQDDEYVIAPPVVIGHETAGTVVAVGAGVTRCRVGDRATSSTTISTCGRCPMCRAGRTNLCPERRFFGGHVNGGFAEYAVIPEANALVLPESVSLAAAALTEPLACCVHGVLEVAPPARGDLVVVSGPGPIGLLCAQAARSAGATVIVLGTSADEKRFEIARRVGLDTLVDVQQRDVVEAVRDLGGGREPDLVVEAAGAAASIDQCLRLAPRGGRVLQIGLYGRPAPVAIDVLVLKELRLLGSFSSTPTSWSTAIELMASGQVQTEPIVTHRRPLEEWSSGFDDARRKGEGKILLVP